MMRFNPMIVLAIVLVLCGAIAPRIGAAMHQCYMPTTRFSAACFWWDFLTGEDL